MRVLLFIAGGIAFLIGWIVFASAKSSIHEIAGMTAFILSAICISSASIIDAILGSTDRIVSKLSEKQTVAIEDPAPTKNTSSSSKTNTTTSDSTQSASTSKLKVYPPNYD